jgi:hypothetical protein
VLPPFKPLDPRGASSIYRAGVAPSRAYPSPDDVVWERVLGEDGRPARLWVRGATSTDPKQGRIGDCWLISAMSLIATRDGGWLDSACVTRSFVREVVVVVGGGWGRGGQVVKCVCMCVCEVCVHVCVCN